VKRLGMRGYKKPHAVEGDGMGEERELKEIVGV
jgi:hypothetical protein